MTAAGGTSYAYDANGRMTSRGGAAITWYSYDLPRRINYGSGSGAVSSEFFYGTGRSRYKQLRRAGASVISTIYYVGSLYERETAGGTTTHRHHIFAGGQAIGQMTRTQAGANSFEYFHRDHQGSVTKVTNGSGAVIQSLSYDAFGKRRNADWSADTAGNRFNDTHFTKQGYTGHEHLDNVRLIHMNGRVQDPTLGRFISPDPFVQNPANSQNYDRFGYTYNNPLSHTDPTGFIFKKIARVVRSIGREIRRSAAHIITQVALTPLDIATAGATFAIRSAVFTATNFATDAAERRPERTGGFNSTGGGGNPGGSALITRFDAAAPRDSTSRQSQPKTAWSPDSMENAQGQARRNLQTLVVEGKLDLTKEFSSAGEAAKYVLPIIEPVTTATGIELGGYIERIQGQRFVIRQVFVGLPGTVPQLSGPRPPNAAAGFHTHPSGSAFFSRADVNWVNHPDLPVERRIPLYVIGGGEIRVCGVSLPSCNPAGAVAVPEGPSNRATRGVIVQ